MQSVSPRIVETKKTTLAKRTRKRKKDTQIEYKKENGYKEKHLYMMSKRVDKIPTSRARRAEKLTPSNITSYFGAQQELSAENESQIIAGLQR